MTRPTAGDFCNFSPWYSIRAGRLPFPSYFGNGMLLSLGNIEAGAKVGLLFIDSQTPRRVRGEARLLRNGQHLGPYEILAL